MKKHIAERLVMARINRVLTKSNQRLHQCRKTDRMFETYGTYWLQDSDGRIVKDHIDLEKMGRETGAIAEWETMVGHRYNQNDCYQTRIGSEWLHEPQA